MYTTRQGSIWWLNQRLCVKHGLPSYSTEKNICSWLHFLWVSAMQDKALASLTLLRHCGFFPGGLLSYFHFGIFFIYMVIILKAFSGGDKNNWRQLHWSTRYFALLLWVFVIRYALRAWVSMSGSVCLKCCSSDPWCLIILLHERLSWCWIWTQLGNSVQRSLSFTANFHALI